MARNDQQDEDATRILRIALEEQRLFHQELTGAFETQRNRIVYYIGAILAVLTFIYSGALDTSKSTQQKLFIPEELYGMLFYFFAVACIVYALFILVKGMHPNEKWTIFTDTTEQKVLGGVDPKMSERDYLQAMVDGYEQATNDNLRAHARKSQATRAAFFPMLIGAILLVVLRFFQ